MPARPPPGDTWRRAAPGLRLEHDRCSPPTAPARPSHFEHEREVERGDGGDHADRSRTMAEPAMPATWPTAGRSPPRGNECSTSAAFERNMPMEPEACTKSVRNRWSRSGRRSTHGARRPAPRGPPPSAPARRPARTGSSTATGRGRRRGERRDGLVRRLGETLRHRADRLLGRESMTSMVPMAPSLGPLPVDVQLGSQRSVIGCPFGPPGSGGRAGGPEPSLDKEDYLIIHAPRWSGTHEGGEPGGGRAPGVKVSRSRRGRSCRRPARCSPTGCRRGEDRAADRRSDARPGERRRRVRRPVVPLGDLNAASGASRST